MKRKASVLEEPITASDWPSMDYSPSCSNSTSPESVKAIADHARFHTQWNVGAVPYINLRTQKRYRDNRPDAETIHQNTLAKLFDAQKHMHMEEQQQLQQQHQLLLLPQQEKFTWQTIPSPFSEEIGQHARPKSNQRSINSFFGGSTSIDRPITRDGHAERMSYMHSGLQSSGECDDCGGPLPRSDRDLGNLGDMDVDMDLESDDCACVSCSKRVCNMCAVRGDHRVCLECAVPGAG